MAHVILRLLFALVPTAICLAGLSASAHAQDAARPGVIFDLVLRQVAVESTKISGESWDPLGGKPDLRIDVRCGARHYRSPVKKDTFVHDSKARAIRVRAGDVVEIAVWDQDAVTDDFIGSIKITITAADIAAGGLSRSAFGRVNELQIELKR